ncbi:MAG: manganese efflux pump MntP family protein [Zoogloeaceae bacterium]|jgi:putative Mn2+ efflux pump MntP|nr:manganese efflux pump MntP family protein [Zoogloeaceae bacterium]
MGLFEIIVIAIGLAMDAFAVSIALGLSIKNLKYREMIIPGIYFGGFQVLMPIAGYFAGVYFANRIQNLDHWIAFILLGSIGGKMIKESFSKDKNEGTNGYSLKFAKMLVLALATSIDALAVGITFAFFEVNIIKAAAIIGIITFFISVCGVKIGAIFGTRFKSKAEFIGGAILIIIGMKILIEHMFS